MTRSVARLSLMLVFSIVGVAFLSMGRVPTPDSAPVERRRATEMPEPRPFEPVEKDRLAGVEDFGSRLPDAPFFYLLDHARHQSVDSLRERAETVTRELLFRDRERLRGEPVRLVGRVRQTGFYPAAENEYGISDLHELWIMPKSTKGNRVPVGVVLADMPNLPEWEGPVGPIVEVVGFPFMWKRGEKGDGESTATPVLLAREVRLLDEPNLTPLADYQHSLGLAAGLAVLLVLLGVYVFGSTPKATTDKASSASPEVDADALFGNPSDIDTGAEADTESPDSPNANG